MVRPLYSGPGFLLCANLRGVFGMNIGHAVHRQHVQDAPIATVTEDPLAMLEKLNFLRGDGLELKPRRDVSSTTNLAVTIAPDETCGYVSGESDVPVTCDNDRSCSWAASDGVGLIACGSQVYVNCVESKSAVNANDCNEACQSNTFNLLCTNSDNPFCYTYAFSRGISAYACVSSSQRSVESVKFTYEGQDDAGFITTTVSDEVTSTIEENVTVTVNGKGTEKTTSIYVHVIPQFPSDVTTPSDSPASDQKSTTPVGAIVGGVVGGVAALGLLSLGIFCLLRRRKPKTQDSTAPVDQPTMAQQPYQPFQQGFASPCSDPSNTSAPMRPDAHISYMTGSVGTATPMRWSEQPSSAGQTPAPAYEMAGPEAREPEEVHEMGTDSVKRK